MGIQETMSLLYMASAISFGKIRRVLLILVVVVSSIQYIRIHKGRKKVTKEQDEANIQKYFKQNEEGQYPWEVDTNDDPKSIPKDSQRINNSWGPKRGRW